MKASNVEATCGDYVKTADALTNRIIALGPQILSLTSAWDLFGIDGFKCDDLAPSLFQASWALKKAQAIVKASV